MNINTKSVPQYKGLLQKDVNTPQLPENGLYSKSMMPKQDRKFKSFSENNSEEKTDIRLALEKAGIDNSIFENSEKDTRQMSIKDASAAGADNIGAFDESNPDIRYSVKDDKKKRSEFYENTAKRATAIPQEVKEKLNPESFDFIPESSTEWQAQAEKNVMSAFVGCDDKLYLGKSENCLFKENGEALKSISTGFHIFYFRRFCLALLVFLIQLFLLFR